MDSLLEQKINKRLIVLLPDCLACNTDLARRIYQMADREALDVLYLVLVDHEENSLGIARCMATMKAITSANKLRVDVKLSKSGQWLETLRNTSDSGDVILCQEEQAFASGPFKTIPFSDFFSNQLNLPVRTISGFYHPFQDQATRWFFEVGSVVGFLVILALFTWLEINLDMVLDGTLAKISLIISFCTEGAAIWTWYKFAYR